MKKLALILANFAAVAALADTWTWTGDAGDGIWENAANWLRDGAATTSSPGANWSGDLTLDTAGTVNYNSGDLAFTGTFTIKGGATFHQESISWPNFPNGTLILENGTFDLPNVTGAISLGTMVFNAGGTANVAVGLGATKSIVINEGGVVTSASGIDSTKLTLNDGATFTSTAGDFYIPADTTFGNINLTVYTITTGTANQDGSRAHITLNGTTLAATRPGAVCGIWDARYAGEINFAPGANSSFTFPSSVDGNTITDKQSAYTYLFATKYFYFNGAEVAENSAIWTDHFDVSVANGMATVTYTDTLSANRISSVGATGVTSTTATLSATIASQEAGTTVRFAYGKAAPAESDILAAEALTVEDGAATVSLSDLEDLAAYHYLFAIVGADGQTILDSKAGSFIASSYDYIYANGEWVGGREPVNLPASIDSVYFASDFTTAGELRLDNKLVKNATLTSGTMLYGTLQVVNSTVVNTRVNTLNQAPYGFYGDGAVPLDFTSESGDGTIYRASSYTCRCTDAQYDAFYAALVATGKIRRNGQTVSAEDYAAYFTLAKADEKETGTYDYGEGAVEEEMNVATLTLWDAIPADASGDWTVKSGARVRLAGKTRLGSLRVESGAVIDLAGNSLLVESFYLDGAKCANGDYTAANSAVLTGIGTMSAGRNGLVLCIR